MKTPSGLYLLFQVGVKAALAADGGVKESPDLKTGLRGKFNRVVLAYSGGLDTSVIVPWLR